MISAALISLNLVFLQVGASAGAPELVIRRKIIIRVPTTTAPTTTPLHRWKDRKGPKCISGRGIGGAILVSTRKVDFILPGGSRIRAELESSCPALDFYSGFYLRPDPEDRLEQRRPMHGEPEQPGPERVVTHVEDDPAGGAGAPEQPRDARACAEQAPLEPHRAQHGEARRLQHQA